MSVLYCSVPHFGAVLARRDRPELGDGPLVLVGPEERVLDASPAAAACGIGAGMTAAMARARCPESRLLDADVARLRVEEDVLLDLLEDVSPRVEPHGWGAAYVDLGDLVKFRTAAVDVCRHVGTAVRREMGPALQPVVGWNSNKFTAQVAARRVPPGHLRAIERASESTFLDPLPVTLLPLAGDTLRRLHFLGLRTLGHYGALPRAAVWQQFGRAGITAYHCARGRDNRPVVPRRQARHLSAAVEFEAPLNERARLLAALRHLVTPLLARLDGNLQACGLVRLAVHFDGGNTGEQERAFLTPIVAEERVVRALDDLLGRLHWHSGAVGLEVVLADIQDTVIEQLSLFPTDEKGEENIEAVRRYLVARFGPGSRLRRPVLAHPGAPLAEWRVGWLDDEVTP